MSSCRGKSSRSAFNTVSEGVVNGLNIREFTAQRTGNEVSIEIALGEKGAVNQEAYTQGHLQVAAYLEDPEITTYKVRARSVSTTQVLFTAPRVPGHGYRTFWVRSKEIQAHAAQRLNPLAARLVPAAARLASSPLGAKIIAKAGP